MALSCLRNLVSSGFCQSTVSCLSCKYLRLLLLLLLFLFLLVHFLLWLVCLSNALVLLRFGTNLVSLSRCAQCMYEV